MQSYNELVAVQTDKTFALTGRTFKKTIAIFGIFFFIPLCGLLSFQLIATHTGVNYENTLLFFWAGLVYLATFWHLMPTRYWEILIYSFVISLVSCFIYVFQGNTNLENGGSKIEILLYSPWIQIFLISIVYYPIKYGFDYNVRQHPLEKDEEGYYSQNYLIRYLQVYYDLPSFRPRAMLFGIFSFIFAVFVVFNGMWDWLASIKIKY